MTTKGKEMEKKWKEKGRKNIKKRMEANCGEKPPSGEEAGNTHGAAQEGRRKEETGMCKVIV